MSVRTLREGLNTVQAHLDLSPVLLLAVMYGVIAFLPFGIFGWLQNEDGLMEWGSVALLILTAINAFRLQKQSQQGWDRLGWLILFVLCCLFIGEETAGASDCTVPASTPSARSTPRGKRTCTTSLPSRGKGSCISAGQAWGWCSASEGFSSAPSL